MAAELLQLLPDEVLLQIFQVGTYTCQNICMSYIVRSKITFYAKKYVPWHDFINVACVCQRWANLIRDKQFLYELGIRPLYPLTLLVASYLHITLCQTTQAKTFFRRKCLKMRGMYWRGQGS